MILGFKQLFDDRTPTFFEEKILAGVGLMELNELAGTPKIHSMREGDRWESGMSIQMAYGVRQKSYRQFNKGIPELETCKSVQDVFMTFINSRLEITVDDHYLFRNDREKLISNDGLTESEFISWFFKKKDSWSGQIIHWTNFKY